MQVIQLLQVTFGVIASRNKCICESIPRTCEFSCGQPKHTHYSKILGIILCLPHFAQRNSIPVSDNVLLASVIVICSGRWVLNPATFWLPCSYGCLFGAWSNQKKKKSTLVRYQVVTSQSKQQTDRENIMIFAICGVHQQLWTMMNILSFHHQLPWRFTQYNYMVSSECKRE